MVEIIPSINVAAFEEVVRRIRISEPHVRMVHLDVADGTFTPQAVWHEARDLFGFKTPLAMELHFMVAHPEEKIGPWLETPVSRVIFHLEATQEARFLTRALRDAEKQVGIAIRPDTPWEEMLPYVSDADLLQTLAVPPGPSGQVFDPATLEKIKALRARNPVSPIEVDGGIQVGVARKCAHAGATILVVGESLFSGPHPFEEMIRLLREDAAG